MLRTSKCPSSGREYTSSLGWPVGCSKHVEDTTGWSKRLCTNDEYSALKNLVYSNNPHTINDFKMAIKKYTWDVDRAILNTVFENTVRRVNKCLETDGGQFEHYS
jgi:hypothetical protein